MLQQQRRSGIIFRRGAASSGLPASADELLLLHLSSSFILFHLPGRGYTVAILLLLSQATLTAAHAHTKLIKACSWGALCIFFLSSLYRSAQLDSSREACRALSALLAPISLRGERSLFRYFPSHLSLSLSPVYVDNIASTAVPPRVPQVRALLRINHSYFCSSGLF